MNFILPFSSSMRVLWGGPTKVTNRHHGAGAQHYAVDFISNYTDRPHRLVDYAAYEADVLASADGEVVEAVNGVHDTNQAQ